ncbi:MAG: nucleoside 2-deoxyribosyltransferase [Desulfobacula sp.]|nr:nucleoside 2-deoxyribosyltransferase [Desulfobacula sp.]
MKKAYLGIKYHSDHRNKEKIEFISSMLEKFGFSTTCITRDIEKWGQIKFSPNDLMLETFNIIESSNIAVIDLSEKGVGLGIEAGYAYSRQIPIITISEKQKISTTLLGISQDHIVYDKRDDLIDFFKQALI